jgi:hypothetical protein
MKMEQTYCSETSSYKTQAPGIHTRERVQHSERGESLKSKIKMWHKMNRQGAALYFFTNSQSSLLTHISTDMSRVLLILLLSEVQCVVETDMFVSIHLPQYNVSMSSCLHFD